MSETSQVRSREFLKISGQFKLGALVTEASHPVTAQLSDTSRQGIAAALGLLFEADGDVIKTFRNFVRSGRANSIRDAVVKSIRGGGRIFFTGCGSTGRLSILLDSVWRDFWQRQEKTTAAADLENRSFSIMAGGDYALIKSVEGFEDFTAFGKKQIQDLGVSSRDVVFAITEGGETSFVIGTAWAGVEAGAKVYFVYNNPDDILCEHVQRSCEVIQDARIEKVNLTTGPMSVTGSTRMQATSIQLAVMLMVLEMAARELAPGVNRGATDTLPLQFLAALEEMHQTLKSPAFLSQLAEIVALEESVYRAGHKNNYFADRFGIDVLTDTTERSPTYCSPPFRKFDDTTASESWAFLFVPQAGPAEAWRHILKRAPRCVEWSEAEVHALVEADKFQRTIDTVRKISCAELMRFKVGTDGLPARVLKAGDCAIGVVSETEKESAAASGGFFRVQLEAARKSGAKTGIIYFGNTPLAGAPAADKTAFVPLPNTGFVLDGVTRVAVKLVMNALSTCTMVRLGRVMGNVMIWVVPSNLKLIDRATRYICQLTGLNYESANQLLFEVIEYVEPRMKLDRAYPPAVGLSVLRARERLTNEDAEKRLMEESAKKPV